MSTDEYVPSDEEMLSAYVTGRMMRDGLMRTEAEQEFRCGLARVRRDAWHEGMLAGDCAAYNGHTTPPNPYEETP